MAAVFLPLLALLAMAMPAAGVMPAAAAGTAPAVTFTAAAAVAPCPAGTYSVPAGTHYVEVIAIGGAGRGGYTFNDNNTGGPGGSGARVRAILPVTPGQELKYVVAHNGDAADPAAGFPNGGATAFASGKGGGSSVVTTGAGDPCLGAAAERGAILVLAGGGGGGGGASPFGSGGAGGNAGANLNRSGQAGSRAYYPSGYDGGSGGGGGTTAGAGFGGGGGCSLYCARPGLAGTGFTGGAGRGSFYDDDGADGAGGAGGGGYYGGGGGGGGNNLGGGGGGAGSSYITPTNYPAGSSQDTSGKPSVTITPLAHPTTTATLSGTTSGNNWFTSAMTVTLTAQAGTFGLGKTYYALDNPTCSAANVHLLERCMEYKGAFTLVGGVHTLTYFSIDAEGLDEATQATSFAVTPTTTAGVTAANLGTGTNPTAAAGGAAGAAGSVSVTSTGSGVVGAAVYGANPAGATVFNSSGAFVDVIVPGSGLTDLTILDCHLNGGTTVSWWNGTAWVLASPQEYDGSRCVTIAVTATSSPTLGELTGTVLAAGRPPTTTAVATTTGGKPYTAGTWTNQSVTVAFTCTAGATPSAPVTVAGEGQGQVASGTCTDGVGQVTETTFTRINVDKTPPSCAVVVSPTVIWTPDGKPVAIAGAVTARDTLSGIARVLGGAVTSNEKLGRNDVRGFTVNATYATPLQLNAVVNVAGTLVATRAGDGNGRVYAQLVTVTDQAGNTNTAPCTWTVTVPHDQR